jgi:hypothetical protein
VIINQIVDRRSSSKRPTGMLTNHNIDEMTRLLGERVMDRMKLGNTCMSSSTGKVTAAASPAKSIKIVPGIYGEKAVYTGTHFRPKTDLFEKAMMKKQILISTC